jgi:5-methylcytosine-specific restriction protein A
MFKVDSNYSKNDIYTILNVPIEKQRGDWDKGCHRYENSYFIFANVDSESARGFNYSNHFTDFGFKWEAQNDTNINQDRIKNLLSGDYNILIFTRSTNKTPYTFIGYGVAINAYDTTPVGIDWVLHNSPQSKPFLSNDEKTYNEVKNGKEGSFTRVLVNRYERDKSARENCIRHLGCSCSICGFNFESEYGEMGKGFIHVHHIIPLSEIKEEYKVNPLTDLIPVCPNCHAMLHNSKYACTIDDIKSMFEN